jgi:meso-butanediol dehydrogenase/(S,S)-butanediol dehydrogenase/diacetyl reductase
VTGRLDGRTAVVTGAASGIGRETALVFARKGAQVLAVDRDEPGLADTLAVAPAAMASSAVDLTDPDPPARVFAACRQELGLPTPCRTSPGWQATAPST